MTQNTNPTRAARQLKTATAVEIDTTPRAQSTEATCLLEDRARTVIELGIALGKTIEARAALALATDDMDQSAAALIAKTEESVTGIMERFDKFLHGLLDYHSKNHSEQDRERIRKIRNRLCAPFPNEGRRRQRGFCNEVNPPIDFMALEVAAMAAVTCDWAISVATIGTFSTALQHQLETIISIERFIIELGNSLGEEVRCLATLRNPTRRGCAVAVIKGLLEDISEAGRALADEASLAPTFLSASTFTPMPAPSPAPATTPKSRSGNWSRLPLYHGTSAKKLNKILKEGCLRAGAPYEGVSLTLDKRVAEYFACQAALRDPKTAVEAENNAVVIELDGYGLLALFHQLNPGEVDWQRELTCRDDIDQLNRVLIGSEPVPTERFADFLRLGRKAFMPTSEFEPDYALQLSQLFLQDQAKSAPKWWH